MNRRLFFVVAALVIAFSYLGGALAPPLHIAVAAAPSISIWQWVAVDQALGLLDQNWQSVYLPMITR